MLKEFNLYLNVSIASLTFITGIIILIRGKRDINSKVLGGAILSTALWILCIVLSDNLKQISLVTLFVKLAIIPPTFFPLLVVIFSYYFLPNKKKPVSNKTIYLLSIPVIAITLLSFTTLNATNISIKPWGADFTPGILYIVFFLYFLVYLSYAFYVMRQKYKGEEGNKSKNQIKLLLVAIIGSASIGIITNVLSALLGWTQLSSYGPYAGLFLSVIMFYVISKHNLLNIKLIISESLIYFVILVITIDLFFSQTKMEMLFKFIFLLVTIILGRYSLRSIQEEISSKDKIQKLADDLEKANAHLQEVDKVKDDFLSMASHELNTPIAAIEGYLSMILDEGIGGTIPPKAKEYLESVFTSSKRLANLVKDLLNVSRIESGRIHLIYQELKIEDIVEQCTMELASKVREAKHHLEVDLPKHPLPITWADTTRVVEVLINILGNAIKYTPEGGKIVVRAVNDDKKIIISVEDNGKGIPKDKGDRVFEKFTQVDVLKDEVKGTGLGMYISKRFIELHGGKIWFHSDGENKGTTFYFSLPIKEKKPFDPHEGEGPILH